MVQIAIWTTLFPPISQLFRCFTRGQLFRCCTSIRFLQHLCPAATCDSHGPPISRGAHDMETHTPWTAGHPGHLSVKVLGEKPKVLHMELDTCAILFVKAVIRALHNMRLVHVQSSCVACVAFSSQNTSTYRAWRCKSKEPMNVPTGRSQFASRAIILIHSHGLPLKRQVHSLIRTLFFKSASGILRVRTKNAYRIYTLLLGCREGPA